MNHGEPEPLCFHNLLVRRLLLQIHYAGSIPDQAGEFLKEKVQLEGFSCVPFDK